MGIGIQSIPKGSFYLREPRGKNKDIDGIIYLRYFVRGKYVEHSTNLEVPSNHWVKDKQMVSSANKNWKRLNAELEAIKAKFDNQLKEYDGVITPLIVQKVLNGDFCPKNDLPKKTDFVDYCLDYNQQCYNLGKISYSTYDNARYYILAFRKFLKIKKGSEELMLSDLSLDIINQYIDWRLNDKLNTKEAINKTLTPLFKAVKYANDNELMASSVANAIINNYLNIRDREYKSEVKSKKTKYLTPEQIGQLRALYPIVKHDRTREIMDMYMFAFYACGLRVSDIITLEWQHINFKDRTISKNCFKTKRFSIDIPLTDPAIEILQRWQGKNPRFVFDLLPVDFNLKDEKKLKDLRLAKNRVFQESLKSIGEKLGVGFNLTFHSARHSFAVYAIRQGMNIHMISKLLGHASILITERVYAEFLPKEIEKEVRSKLFMDIGPTGGNKAE